jgi:hypothetical protein
MLRELFGKFPKKSPHFEEESYEIAKNAGGFLQSFSSDSQVHFANST